MEPFVSLTSELTLSVRSDRQYDPHYRYKMPPLDVSADSRNKQRKTYLHNACSVARNVFRPEAWLIKYLALSLSTDSGVAAGAAPSYLTGHHDKADLQPLVFGFIQDYVLCKCGSPETLLYVEGKKRSKKAKLQCHSCGRVGSAAGQEDKMLNLFAAQPMQPELCPMLRGDVARANVEESALPMAAPDTTAGAGQAGCADGANDGGDDVSGEVTATTSAASTKVAELPA